VIGVGLACLGAGTLLVVTYWYMLLTPPFAFVGLMISVLEWERHRDHRQCPIAQLAAIATFANLGLFILTFSFLLAQAMPPHSRRSETTQGGVSNGPATGSVPGKTEGTKQPDVPSGPRTGPVPRKAEEDEEVVKPRGVPNWPGTARYGAAGGDTRWPPSR
jgi:hypothetical protein